jgi:Fe-S-cluster containining protein
MRRALPLARETRFTPEVLAGIAEGEARIARALLDRGDTEAIVEAARQASAQADRLVGGAVEREPPSAPIACRAGCPSCCTAKVLVVAPEVIRIAEHLRATRDPEALAALLERVRAASEAIRGATRAERAEAQVFCPLLEDGSCSIHPVRPLVCGGWNSTDAAACERDHQAGAMPPTAPIYAPQYELANAVLAGLGKACFDIGLDGLPLELIAALRIALERPNAAERWRRRLPVFSQARDEEWIRQNVPTRAPGA